MKKQITKRQHIIPKMHLKHFSVDQKIFVYDKAKIGLLSKDRIPIKDVGVQNWYYDKDNTVEDELSKLETKTDKIFLRIIKTRKINSLSIPNSFKSLTSLNIQ